MADIVAGIEGGCIRMLCFQKTGNTGNLVGSLEATSYAAHSHNYTYNNDYWNCAATAIGDHAETNAGVTWTTAANGSLTESRPININVNYLIKAVTA